MCKVRQSPELVGFILWAGWMSELQFMAIFLILVEIFQSGPKWWIDWPSPELSSSHSWKWSRHWNFLIHVILFPGVTWRLNKVQLRPLKLEHIMYLGCNITHTISVSCISMLQMMFHSEKKHWDQKWETMPALWTAPPTIYCCETIPHISCQTLPWCTQGKAEAVTGS